MDRERNIPMADDTIFRIYSMTKPIASVALMQLYERGMFQLLDPVHRYIPEWRTLQVGEVHDDDSITLVKPQRPMNMRDVLMHTTGLPGAALPRQSHRRGVRGGARRRWVPGQTLESVTALLAQHPLKFHPGTHWNYGLSTDIVGPAGRDPLGAALRRVPPARDLRAARDGRHRLLRARGPAPTPRRLLPVPARPTPLA